MRTDTHNGWLIQHMRLHRDDCRRTKWGRSGRQRTTSPAGDLSPRPGNGTQHDSEGTGCQCREEAEVQHTLHPVIAHPYHCIQVVLQRSNRWYNTNHEADAQSAQGNKYFIGVMHVSQEHFFRQTALQFWATLCRRLALHVQIRQVALFKCKILSV